MKFCTNCGAPVRQSEPARDPVSSGPVAESAPIPESEPVAAVKTAAVDSELETDMKAAAPVDVEDGEESGEEPDVESEPAAVVAPDAFETAVLDPELQKDAQAAEEADASLNAPVSPAVSAAAFNQAEPAAPEASQVQPTVVAPAIQTPIQQPAPQQPAAGPSAAPTKKPNRLHTGLLIAAVCLLAVIAVGVGYLVVSSRPLEVAFGQSDSVPTSFITRIKPKGSDGKLMTSYTVALVAPAGSQNQEATSPDTTPYKIQVEGDNGFTIGDFGADIPDGNYTVVIENEGSGTQQQLPITYEHDNPQAKDEVTVAPPAPEQDGSKDDSAKEDAKNSAAKLFYAKVKEYEDEYGSPRAENVGGVNQTMMFGLCVAQQLDFDGDGTDELLLVYNPTYKSGDEVSDIYTALNAYVVEVWAFKDGEISKTYSSTKINTSNGGMGFCNIYKNSDSGQLALAQTDYNHENDVEETGYYTFDGSEFSVAQTFQVYNPYASSTFAVDGKTVEQDAYLAASDAWKLFASYSLLEGAGAKSDASSGFLNASDVVAATEQTVADLKEAAGDGASEKKDKGESKKKSKDLSYTMEPVYATETFETPGSGDDSSETSYLWSYPVISVKNGKETKAVKSLNAMFKKSYEDDLAASKSWTLDSGDQQTWWHRTQVTSIADGIASVRQDRYLYGGGMHGNSEVVCTFYDLATGKEIAAKDALGMSDADIKDLVSAGIRAFFENNPSDLLETSSDREEAIAEVAAQPNRVFRTDDAIVVHTGDYELGSYAFGTRDIVIKALGNAISVGDDISSQFKEQ